MSIFASLWSPSDDEHEDACAIYVEDPPGSNCYELSGKPCDCGQPNAPLIYQGSHILPDARNDKRGGWVDLALIPGHITRDGRDGGDEDTPWPYLRLGVGEETVILTRRHVEEIAAELNEWLTGSAKHPELPA